MNKLLNNSNSILYQNQATSQLPTMTGSLQSNLSSLGSSAFTTALNTAGSTAGAAGSNAAKTAAGLSKGQAWLGGIGAALSAAQLGFNIYSQITSHQLAEQQLKDMKAQLEKENTRWQNREDERKENNRIASAYATPELPTQRD